MPAATLNRIDTEAAITKLKHDESFHLSLPGGGKLSFTRAVPFLTIYRYQEPVDRFALHAEEVAYCVLSEAEPPAGFTALLEDISTYLSERFGGMLILDIRVNEAERLPAIAVHSTRDTSPAVSEALIRHLKRLDRKSILPDLAINAHTDDSKMSWLPAPQHQDVLVLGIEVSGFFLKDDGHPFPLVLRKLREYLQTALRRTFFDFIRLETNYNASHFHQLGSRQVDDLVWEIDRKLVEISTSFPFLMLVTATNDDEAFEQFTQTGYREEPSFHYRFLPVDPEVTVRELFNLPIGQIRDATLAYILRDKRDETFRMLDMLANRGTPAFRYGSMQVFGGVEDDLLAIANSLLTIVPQPDPAEETDRVGAEEFLAECGCELNYLSRQHPDIEPRAQVRTDMSGLMVSQGVLNIGHRLRVPHNRVQALIQHEINTHVLTYWNGRAQPLTLLHSGTPGYEDLQEGLAVLSEWFVDGLTGARMRILAARVVGIAHMLRGHTFGDTFSLLHERHDLPARTAFYTTARIYRCGGFTKDAVYLRGLVQLLDYLREGGELEPLFIGKLRLDYVPLLDELRERGILLPPPLIPRYFSEDRARGHPKLNRLREGMTVFDLIPRK